MSSAKKSKTTEFGLNHALDALSGLDPEHRERLLKQIGGMDPEVAEELNRRMFRFEDLIHASSRSLAEMLKEVKDKTLCLSLRGASQDLLMKVFSCFSSRKVEMLKEEITNMGPQPVRKVDEAKAEIMSKAKAWVDDGKLVLENSEKMVP